MDFSIKKEFLRDLQYCKNGFPVWGTQYDLKQALYSLRYQVKEYFPMNGVPKSIMDQLELLQMRFEILETQLTITIDRIIEEIEKDPFDRMD